MIKGLEKPMNTSNSIVDARTKRTVTMTLKNINLRERFDIKTHPKVKDYCEKHNMVMTMTDTITLAGVRVKVHDGKEVYFNIRPKELELNAKGIVATSHPVVTSQFRTKHLALERSGHARDFRSLFKGEREVAYFSVGLSVEVNFNQTTIKVTPVETLSYNFEPLFVGDCGDLSFSPDTDARLKEEVGSITNGIATVDFMAVLQFHQVVPIDPPAVPADQTALQRVVVNDKKIAFVNSRGHGYVTFPVRAEGQVKHEVHQTNAYTIPNDDSARDPMPCKFIASFTEASDAVYYAEIRAFMQMHGLSYKDVLDAIDLKTAK